ncbi:MAG: hypothetical protein ACK5MZ_06080, partial [Aestuariibaculum sp.]
MSILAVVKNFKKYILLLLVILFFSVPGFSAEHGFWRDKVEVVSGVGKALLLTKFSAHTKVKIWINSLNKTTYSTLLEKLDDGT